MDHEPVCALTQRHTHTSSQFSHSCLFALSAVPYFTHACTQCLCILGHCVSAVIFTYLCFCVLLLLQAWGTAYPAVVEALYRTCGDKAAVARHYTGMSEWVAWMQSQVVKTGLSKLYSNYGECV